MSIEAFQIATAVFGATTVGLAHLAYGLRNELKGAHERVDMARDHVSRLQITLSHAYTREEQLERQNTELNEMVTKVHNQRLRALDKARAKSKASADEKQGAKAAAAAKTLSALQAAPLRPRDEVIANIRSSKVAQQVSSAN